MKKGGHWKQNKFCYTCGNLWKLYKIRVPEYNEMLAKQDGKCAICSVSESDDGKKFHVDHCHTTGKVRGLLCNNCNNGLGRFRDNTEYLQNAIHYLSTTA